jgi:acyl-coenzyme A thioesterase 13
MAMIYGEMTSPDGKVKYSTCEHHKVAVPTRKEHLTPEFEVEWDRVWKKKLAEEPLVIKEKL